MRRAWNAYISADGPAAAYRRFARIVGRPLDGVKRSTVASCHGALAFCPHSWYHAALKKGEAFARR